MKNVILLIAFALSPFTSFAQLEVKESSPKIIGEANFTQLEKIDEGYLLTYRDLKFQHLNEYKSFTFKSFDDLYNFLVDGIEEKRKDEEDITLDGVDLTVDFNRAFGVGSVQITHRENGTVGLTPWLTKKQIEKIFGKE